jgi:hypothetical protein
MSKVTTRARWFAENFGVELILLVTNKRDITTDFIVLELQRRGEPFLRLNSEDLPSASVSFRPEAGASWEIELDGKRIALREVGAAYYRRPGAPEAPANISDKATREYLSAEWSAVLRSIWNALEGRWLSSPFAILRAEDKPRQLELALALGFEIPNTMIGNDFSSVLKFVSDRGVVGKPLRHALIDREPAGEVLFTSRLGILELGDRSSVELAPVIYQQEVPKAYDVRVTVIGERVFATAIHSQDHEESEVDWRSGTRLDLVHEVISLPETLSQKCVELTRALDLRYGAIDLIADTSDRYWFLETNPNGQWAWIERRTKLPLAAAIVDELVRIAA